ncbi:unnamed protein product [Closterium sp. NIES-54]
METQAGRPEPSGFRNKRPRKAAQWLNPLLRFLQLAAAVSAFPVMIRAGAGLLWFSNWHAFSFLIAGTVIAGFWALLMLLLDCFLAASGKLLHSTALLWAIVIGDFIALSMALSAGAATAAITTLNDQGLPAVPSSAQGQRPSTPSVLAPKDSSFCVSSPHPPLPTHTFPADCSLHGFKCWSCHGCLDHVQRPGPARPSPHLHGVNALQHLLRPYQGIPTPCHVTLPPHRLLYPWP